MSREFFFTLYKGICTLSAFFQNMESLSMYRFIRYLALFFAVMALPAAALAQNPAARKATLLGVKVEGASTFNDNVIRIHSGLTEGATVTGDDVQNAIRTLWELGFFSDVQIVIDREVGDSGIEITIKVEEFPRLEKVQFKGNKRVKEKTLQKELDDAYRGLAVSPARLNNWRHSIKDLYKDKGFLLAEVSSDQVAMPDDSGKVSVLIDIKEGNKVQVKKINFHGNLAFGDKKLRKQMKKTKEDTWYRGADFDPEKFEADKDLVVDFYRSKGFRDAELVRDSLSYGPENKAMFVDVWVKENTKYYFGKIEFEGNELFTSEQLAQVINFQSGDEYSAKKLIEAQGDKLSTAYWDAGYIWANINPRELPAGNDTIDVKFFINEGKAAEVGKVKIVGNTRTKEKVIRRSLFVRPGQKFSRELLVRSARELWVLNYFGNVNPQPVPVDEENVDIVLEVEEKSTDTANMSAGWSELDRFIGNIGVSMNNLFGNGQQFAFDWNFGRFFRSFQINFTEPWLFDKPMLAGISFYDIKREARYTGYKQESRGGSVRVGRRLAWPDNFFRGDWIYKIDRTNLTDFIGIFSSLSIAQEQYPITSSSITQIFSRNSLNRAEFPTNGSNFSFSSEVAGSFLGGNVNYHKQQFKAEWFSPLIGSLVLHSNFEIGLIRGYGGKARIPYLERFFMGGEGLTRSIPLRGYDDPLSNSVSDPRLRIGGETMMKYSFEVRLPVSPNPTIFALTFLEAGNTWESLERTNFGNLRRSVGFGARIHMPLIGILGFDYAYGFDNVDPITGERFGKWKPHFVFGRSF